MILRTHRNHSGTLETTRTFCGGFDKNGPVEVGGNFKRFRTEIKERLFVGGLHRLIRLQLFNVLQLSTDKLLFFIF